VQKVTEVGLEGVLLKRDAMPSKPQLLQEDALSLSSLRASNHRRLLLYLAIRVNRMYLGNRVISGFHTQSSRELE
jgi:hypothetical protein